MGFHERASEKMSGYQHFTVGKHPEFKSTRCFLVSKADGTLEDFSISKCIAKMESEAILAAEPSIVEPIAAEPSIVEPIAVGPVVID